MVSGQIEANHLGMLTPRLGDANRALSRFNHWSPQTDNNKLRLLALLLNHFGKALNIGTIEKHIHLIKGIEGGRAIAL